MLSSVADPDPGSGAFLTPGSGMGKKSRSGSGMEKLWSGINILDPQLWSKILFSCIFQFTTHSTRLASTQRRSACFRPRNYRFLRARRSILRSTRFDYKHPFAVWKLRYSPIDFRTSDDSSTEKLISQPLLLIQYCTFEVRSISGTVHKRFSHIRGSIPL